MAKYLFPLLISMTMCTATVIPPTIANQQDFEQQLSSTFKNGKKLVILSDYDGTLAPLTFHPNDTVFEEGTEKALKALAANPKVFVAVISGRGVDDVKSRVGIDSVTYSGSHGLDILNPDGSTHNYPIPDEVKANMSRLVNKMNAELTSNGGWVEDKQSSVTFHYRGVPVEGQDKIRDAAAQMIQSFGFNPSSAHCAVELKPEVNWHKGEAALYILKTNFGDNWQDVVNVVFAGDDTTDEDAMISLKGKGITFRIALKDGVKTNADFLLPSTKTMSQLLQWLQSISQ